MKNFQSFFLLTLLISIQVIGCNRISQRASNETSSNSTALTRLNSKHGAERIELYNKMAAKDRCEAWKTKLSAMLKLNWSQSQETIIKKVLDKCTPSLFNSRIETAELNPILSKKDVQEFSPYQFLRVFYYTDLDLGAPGRPNAGDHNGKPCTCKPGLYCSGPNLSICRESNCYNSPSYGCGFMMMEQCTGECYELVQWLDHYSEE